MKWNDDDDDDDETQIPGHIRLENGCDKNLTIHPSWVYQPTSKTTRACFFQGTLLPSPVEQFGCGPKETVIGMTQTMRVT